MYLVITISFPASSADFQHDQLFLLRSIAYISAPYQTMTRYLQSGCGSPVKLDDYYWVCFDQKQTSGQKQKRKTAPRACKTRKRYTRRRSHKVSKSKEEDLNHSIVCITLLEPLGGEFLEWTDTLAWKKIEWGNWNSPLWIQCTHLYNLRMYLRNGLSVLQQ